MASSETSSLTLQSQASVTRAPIQDQIATVIILLYQAAALGVLVCVPLLFFSWLSVPFPGVMVEHTLVTNGTGPVQAGSWEAYGKGLNEFGYQVASVQGVQVMNGQEYLQALRQHTIGQQITLGFITPDNQSGEVQVVLGTFPIADQFAQFYIPYLIGLVYLVCGFWVYRLRGQDVAGRAFTLFTTSVAINLVALIEISTTHWLTHLWSLAIPLSGGSIFLLGLVFPNHLQIVRRYPLARWTPLILALGLALFTFTTLFDFTRPRQYVQAWTVQYAFVAAAILIYFFWMAIQGYSAKSPIVREQARLILGGSFVAFAPLMAWFTIFAFHRLPFQLWLLLPLMVFPVATAYAILRYRLLATDFMLSRGMVYALLMILAVGSYGLLVWGASLLISTAVRADHPLVIGLVVFVFLLLFAPLKQRLQQVIDRTFFKGQVVYQEYLQQFSRELTQTIDLAAIQRLLHRYIETSIAPALFHIFLYESLSHQYLAVSENEGRPNSDLRFPGDSPLAQSLHKDQNVLFIGSWEQIGTVEDLDQARTDRSPVYRSIYPEKLKSDWPRLVLLGAQLIVALPGQERLTGWLALGPKRSGEPYATRDVRLIEALADQATLAIERAQVVRRLERRVHEMNVLARVAQGVNVTIAFDDILELIYAQTYQVLKASHFRITLFNQMSQFCTHAFFLEGDDRLTDRENQPLPRGVGLEQEVIFSQRSIVSEDYERMCRNRGLIPDLQGVYAWIGAPLNTGGATIGAISLASTDPSEVYTSGQQALLQAIADQAAGAIVKSQLLQESERRTRQLQILNQVGRSLTSTLDFDPLLTQILNHAVEILNCEAGSLFMVDQGSGELIFEVVTGPVAGDLVGVRLAPGTGLVGKAVDDRQSIIVNNVQESKDWFHKPDEQTGFVTRALLVVPMNYRDQAIGVIEVINKNDESLFTDDDEQLLAAFAAQAAVAIQNARLFTMTDQALAARVEELSVMQRIDRELNASLDIERALHITLEWAIRQSASSQGAAITIGEERGGPLENQAGLNLRVAAIEAGIARPSEAGATRAAIAAGAQKYPAVVQALSTGQPLHTKFVGEDIRPLLNPRSASQVVIPIQREKTTLGLLVLESENPDHYEGSAFDFLVRLADHAAIAISNARLYEEVQDANQAKNDFISFVSHELKTPMTSIRGYTDLILAGAVGDVNEMQTSFLGTIRSNIDRMGSLVSDLADISRIESGRLRLDFREVSLRDVVAEVVVSTQTQIDAKKQKLHIYLPDELPLAWADYNRMVQVLANLLSNAHKYTPEGGEIFLRAEVTKNRWDNKGAPIVILVAVQDNGIGIRPEDQKQIFTKFFRSEDMKARENPGTGLGLNITKNLVELQGGRIWFESEFRKGTTFFCTVPVGAEDPVGWADQSSRSQGER